MFERFSERARRVIVLSQEEARTLGHGHIGTEHLLLGLLEEAGGIASQALVGLGVTAEATRQLLVAEVGAGPNRAEQGSGHIPFSPRAKKSLELALRQSLRLEHSYIGTEHLLLGLLNEGGGRAITLLGRQELDIGALRSAVLDLISDGQGVERNPGRGRRAARPGDVSTTAAADDAMRSARALAGDDPVGSQHLLLGVLGDPTSAAAKALAGLGVDLAVARRALREVDSVGTTDEAVEQAGRRRMRLRVGPSVLTLEIADQVLLDEAREALAGLGGDVRDTTVISGELDEAVSLAGVWSALRASLADIRRRAAAGIAASQVDDDPHGSDGNGTQRHA